MSSWPSPACTRGGKITRKLTTPRPLWTLTATILISSAVDELLHIHDRNPVPLPRDWWEDRLNPELIGDQHFVDAAVQAALPVAAALDVVDVAPLRWCKSDYSGDSSLRGSSVRGLPSKGVARGVSETPGYNWSAFTRVVGHRGPAIV